MVNLAMVGEGSIIAGAILLLAWLLHDLYEQWKANWTPKVGTIGAWTLTTGRRVQVFLRYRPWLLGLPARWVTSLVTIPDFSQLTPLDQAEVLYGRCSREVWARVYLIWKQHGHEWGVGFRMEKNPVGYLMKEHG